MLFSSYASTDKSEVRSNKRGVASKMDLPPISTSLEGPLEMIKRITGED